MTGADLSNVKRLVNVDPEEWRLRVGDYRVRFHMELRTPEAGTLEHPNDSNAVIVVKIAHRRDIYRG